MQMGLQERHTPGPVSYHRDGLYFLHKEGYYALDHWPLAVLWKDAACSRYFVDTDTAGNALPQQVCLTSPALGRSFLHVPLLTVQFHSPHWYRSMSQAVVLEYRMDRTIATGRRSATCPGMHAWQLCGAGWGWDCVLASCCGFFIEEPGIQVRHPAALVRQC